MNGTVSRAHKEPKAVIHREPDELASVKSDELASPTYPANSSYHPAKELEKMNY